jgi:hypothetical protein
VIGRPLRYREIPPESARQGVVQHGFPEAFADGFLTLQNEDVGQPAFISGEVEEILGRPALTFAERAAEHAADFRN